MSIKNIVIGIAIIILTISVIVYGIGIFYDEPEYEDYCGEFRVLSVPSKPQWLGDQNWTL